MDDPDLAELLATYDRARLAKTRATFEQNIALDGIKRLLEKQGLDKVDTATHRITRFKVTRRNLDKAKLEQHLGDLTPWYSEKVSDGVKVTRIGQGDRA